MSGPLTNGWPSQVKLNQAPALPGDFCGANPRAVVLGNPGQFQAPSGGCVVGRFVWADTDSGAVSQAYVSGRQIAFLHRDAGATLITTFLDPATYTALQGLPLSLFAQGEFWGRFAAGAQPGMNVFADPSDGSLLAGYGVTAPGSAAVTASAGASFTASITTNVMTVTAVASGVINLGDTLGGSGITPVAIGAQLTGTPGGIGTYTVVHADKTTQAMTATGNKMTVTAVASGSIGAGSAISGTNVTNGTTVVNQLSGTPGGVGLYTLSVAQLFAPTTVTEGGILTPFKVDSIAANGELAKISSWG